MRSIKPSIQPNERTRDWAGIVGKWEGREDGEGGEETRMDATDASVQRRADEEKKRKNREKQDRKPERRLNITVDRQNSDQSTSLAPSPDMLI